MSVINIKLMPGDLPFMSLCVIFRNGLSKHWFFLLGKPFDFHFCSDFQEAQSHISCQVKGMF
jgi:hypothetical protein